MARTARLLYKNFVLDAGVTVTASSAATGYPATNLLSPARFQKWRSASGVGNQNVDFDFLTNRTFNVIALADVKKHTGGSLKSQYWDGSAWVDLFFIDVLTPNPTGVSAVFFTNQIRSKVRLLFTNTTAVNEYVEIGVVSIAAYYEPVVSILRGWGLTYVAPDDVVRTPGGQRTAERRAPYAVIRGSMSEPDSERPTLVDVARTVGKHTPVFLAINPDDVQNFMWYGRFDKPPDLSQITVGQWAASFEFSEDV